MHLWEYWLNILLNWLSSSLLAHSKKQLTLSIGWNRIASLAYSHQSCWGRRQCPHRQCTDRSRTPREAEHGTSWRDSRRPRQWWRCSRDIRNCWRWSSILRFRRRWAQGRREGYQEQRAWWCMELGRHLRGREREGGREMCCQVPIFILLLDTYFLHS